MSHSLAQSVFTRMRADIIFGRLAPSQKLRLDELREERGVNTFHLFFAAPNSFAFFLGRLSRSLPEIQLYEFPFGEKDATYYPSIRLGS